MQTTDWHHLFGMTLKDFFTDTFYDVILEEEMSMKKQYLDVLIVRKGEGGSPSEIPDGLESLATHNLHAGAF
ncbi:MAG: hypothetical protein B6245_22540 [Desulfobacteraceae bacterium 4572_88]|nr:MAG: hypothetical protein B6245_22540 [Desulfobacteraceae bacterium 4572_88]